MGLKVASRVSQPFLFFIMCLVFIHLLLRLTLGFGHRTPDLFVVALLIGAKGWNQGKSAALGFLLGALEDGFSADSFGAHAFSLSVLGLVSSRIRDIFVGDSPVFLFAYFFLGKFMREVLYWIAVGNSARDSFLYLFLPDAVLGATYVSLVGVIVTSASSFRYGST
tara:strand:- start:154168 stop:154665 length:498 start_codon:yes stop_codon:yes gene_type:complete